MEGIDTWMENLNEAFQELWENIAFAVPQVIIAVLILIVGWVVGTFVGRVIAHLIKTLKVYEALRQAGVEDVVHRGGVSLNSGYFLGSLVKWFIIVAFLVTALNFLGFQQVNEFILEDLLNYIPQVIIAVLVIFVAAVVGDVLQKIVVASSKAASIASAELLGGVVKWSIWIFAIFVALDHLRIVPEAFIHTLLQGIVIAVALGLGLSFGLGGQRAASEYIDKVRGRISGRDERKGGR